MVGTVAAGLGYLVRGLLAFLRTTPGIVGPVAIVYGVWSIYEPAGWVVAGLVLWAFDILSSRQAPKPERGDE
jgi:hypothetical protein